MEYSNSFIDFVKSSNSIEREYVGSGNPNANILFVGKECAISDSNIEEKEMYLSNALNWEKHIENKTCEILEYTVDETHILRKAWGKNTWSKYQLLKDYIFDENTEKHKVDFLKKIFTTEINDSPSKTTFSADKSCLNKRKLIFKNSKFIQGFPIVVLACSNYVRNNNEIREIDEIFGVTYDGDEFGKHVYSKGNWFFTHHNSDRTKLVIHTRQLSADVKDELLKDIGEIISEHLKK